jgi:hypothetical protein
MASNYWNGGGNGTGPQTAGQKAAATRRANRAAGIPPKSSRPRTGRAYKGGTRVSGPAFSTPKIDPNALLLVALAALEDVFVAKLAGGVTPEARAAYLTYQKLKGLALGPARDTTTQTEANSALRMALVHAIKLAL